MNYTKKRSTVIRLGRAATLVTEERVLSSSASFRYSTSSSLGNDKFRLLLGKPQLYIDASIESMSNKHMGTEEQLDDLIRFLQWKDPKLVEHAHKLWEMFYVEDLANALREKYKLLPVGWRMKIFPSSPPSCHHINDLKSLSDLKINEILDSEERFVNTLIEVEQRYVDELFKVYASNNQRAIASLGLLQSEAVQVFEKLQHIRQFSQTLMGKLECINLIRTQPVAGESRAMHVGRAFKEMSSKLHVYAPAVIGYTQSMQILTEASHRVVTASPKSTGAADTFLTLWEQATMGSEYLTNKPLSSVLITPMQRLPRYEMLLQALVKDCDAEALPMVQEALSRITHAVEEIDASLKRHDKLTWKFGTQAGLNALSTGGSSHNGEIKIVNMYKSKVLKLM